MSEHDKALLIRLLSQVRADFDRLRWQAMRIRAHLLHKATNAEAEGIVGIPVPQGEVVAAGSAGHREGFQRKDELGNPLFRDDPIVDAAGKPIINSAGQAFDFVMPAFRSVTFLGRLEDYHLLDSIAERAGRVVSELPELKPMRALSGWRFSAPEDLWWALLFELAWAGHHPLIVAEKRLWMPAESPNSFVPYDLDQLKSLATLLPTNFQENIPQNWLSRLPDAWVSDFDDVVTTCLDATDYFLEQLLDNTASDEQPDNGSRATEGHAMMALKRRFALAFSFPGERREFVDKVANMLRPIFGEHRFFYDKFHQAELSRPNLDIILQRFYRDDADLIVVFVCGEYSEKEWCGLEWRAIRDLIKDRSRGAEDVMFLRFDDKPLEGMLSIDGYLPIASLSEREVADAILNRWCGMRQQ